MGQYFNIVNVDKREIIPSRIGDDSFGIKLLEFSYEGNARVNALEALLDAKTGKWRGDHVYIVGDYADINDDEASFKEPDRAYATAMKILEDKGVDTDNGNRSLYEIAEDFESINPKRYSSRRYIYNTLKKEVIDVTKLPLSLNDAWLYPNKDHNDLSMDTMVLSPLSLLLAIGNGEGSGDYSGLNTNLIGNWANDSQYIVTSNKKISAYSGFKEFNYNTFVDSYSVLDSTTGELIDSSDVTEEIVAELPRNNEKGIESIRRSKIIRLQEKSRRDIDFLVSYSENKFYLEREINKLFNKEDELYKKYGDPKNSIQYLSKDSINLLLKVIRSEDTMLDKVDAIIAILESHVYDFSALMELGINLNPNCVTEEEAQFYLDDLNKKLSSLPTEKEVLAEIADTKTEMAKLSVEYTRLTRKKNRIEKKYAPAMLDTLQTMAANGSF